MRTMKTGLKSLLFCFVLGLSAQTSWAQFDMFLELDGIQGESLDQQHQGWIELLSFSSGIGRAVSSGSSGGPREVGNVNFSDITVTKTLDRASVPLRQAITQGQNIPFARIEFTKSAGGGQRVTFFEIMLDNVIVSSISTSAASGGSIPVESLSLNFTKIEWTYKQMDETGKVQGETSGSWDLATGKQ